MRNTLGPSIKVLPVTAAAAFLGAAQELAAGVPCLAAGVPATSWALTFLSGQVVESALKSYLSHAGVAEAKLRSRDYGHDLRALWAEAVTRGFAFAPAEPVWLERLADLHTGPFLLRYPMGLNGLVLPHGVELARDMPRLVGYVRSVVQA